MNGIRVTLQKRIEKLENELECMTLERDLAFIAIRTLRSRIEELEEKL